MKKIEEDQNMPQPAGISRSGAFAFSERSSEEFETVVNRNRPLVFRFLLSSSRDPDLAEALTQECFLKAYRNWSRFRGDSQVSTWLMRIAINLQRDYWRSRRMEFWRRTRINSPDADELVRHVPGSDESPERTAVARQQVASIWKTLPTLTENGRTIFLLRVVEEWTFREISEATGMPEGTVKAHFSRSISKIRQALVER